MALSVICALPVSARGEQLPITHFNTANGLAHNRVGCIVQDSHGFVWLCTAEGLSRYDGHTFVNYGIAHGLPYPTVNDVLESGDELWIATNGGGAVRFSTTRSGDPSARGAIPLDVYPVGSTVATNSVNVLYRDKAGRLWAGTDGGLFQLDEAGAVATFRSVPFRLAFHPDETVQVWAIAEDAEGSLWLGSKFGLLRRAPDGRVRQYTIDPTSTADHVWAVVLDDKGRLWLGHNSGLVVYQPLPLDRSASTQGSSESTVLPIPLRLQQSNDRVALRPTPTMRRPILPLPGAPGEAHRYTQADGLAANRVLCLVRSRSGIIWIGAAGLTEFRDGRFSTYTRPHGLDVREITAVAEDRGGNLWLGTIDGAMRVARDGFVAYGAADGFGPTAGAIFQRDAALYAVSNDFRISRFDAAGIVTIKPRLPPDLTPWRSTRVALVDTAGDWWVGTRQGIYRFPRVQRFEDLADVSPKAVYTVKDGLADNDVTRLFEDRRGDIWIAHFPPGEYALSRWDRATGRFHRYGASDGLRSFNPARVFAEDPSGNVWIGFIGGELVRYASRRFEVIVAAQPGPIRSIGALYTDVAGRLWAGAYSAGVIRIDDPGAEQPRVRRYTTSEGLASTSVLALTGDRHGYIYIAHGIGIDRLEAAAGTVKHYTARDGIISTDFVAALADVQGDVWFATAKGLLRLPRHADAAPLAPRVRIGELQSAGARIPVAPLGGVELPPLSLPPGRNDVQIGFFGLAPDTIGGIRYQYRLDGADGDWSPATTQRGVTYANLAPGRYLFQVRAIGVDGAISETPASLRVTVLPHIWQQWWFIALAALGTAMLAYAVYRYRVGRLIELERVRMRLATDLHDDIGSGLSQVAVLSELARRRVGAEPAASEPLSAIGQLSRDLVDSMNDIVWAINPRRDHLADMTHRMRRFASEVLGGRNIDLRFHCEATRDNLGLGPDVRREVWLIFKESVNNLARHSQATHADISIGTARGWLEVRISDDGCGFEPGRASDGNGLSSMRQRASRLGGTLDVVSERGAGSVVILRVPLGKRGRRVA